MIIREKDYLKKTKKKYLKASILWFLIMLAVFTSGYVLNKTRNNIFTVIAAVLVLPSAQYITKLLAILKFKDPNLEESKRLEEIKGNYNIIHSAIIPHKEKTIFFNHIIITENKIFCFLAIRDDEKLKKDFLSKVQDKGMKASQVVFLNFNSKKENNIVLKKIEESITTSKNKKVLANNTRIIRQMIM